MKVRYYAEGSSRARVAHGPADLSSASPRLILLEGEPHSGDFARWGAPIGIAAIKGAEVRTVERG